MTGVCVVTPRTAAPIACDARRLGLLVEVPERSDLVYILAPDSDIFGQLARDNLSSATRATGRFPSTRAGSRKATTRTPRRDAASLAGGEVEERPRRGRQRGIAVDESDASGDGGACTAHHGTAPAGFLGERSR